MREKTAQNCAEQLIEKISPNAILDPRALLFLRMTDGDQESEGSEVENARTLNRENRVVFKLVETRSVETSLLLGLGYANVSLTHSLTPV